MHQVIFWHHRLGHVGGQNISAGSIASAVGGSLSHSTRVALFYDFVKRPEHFKRNAALAAEPSENGDGPPPHNLWQDWSNETQAAALDIVTKSMSRL